MATPKFVNRARMLTSTTGTGTSVALTTAVGGYFTLAEAGLQDGDVVDYVIEDGNDFEIQVGQTYNSSGPSLSRGTPAASKVGGVAGTSQINLTGNAQVFITALAESFDISRYTEQTIITEDDLLLGHSNADGERRRIPIRGVLGLVPVAGLEYLNSGTATTAANLDIVLPSGYRHFRIIIADQITSSVTTIGLRTSSNGGASFDSASNTYAWAELWAITSESGISGAANATSIQLTGTTRTTMEEAQCHVIDVIEVNGTGYKNILSISTGGYGGIAIVGGARKTTNAINAVRIFPGTGTLTCKWSLYGYK